MEVADLPNFLGLIVDLDPLNWMDAGDAARNGGSSELSSYLEAIMVFLDAHILLHEQNRVAVVARGLNSTRVLFPTPDTPGGYVTNPGDLGSAESHSLARRLRGTIEREAKIFVQETAKQLARSDSEELRSEGSTSSALSGVLCMVNRLVNLNKAGTYAENEKSTDTPASGLETRILCLVAGADTASDYVPIMNCAFSAQRLGVAIDALVVADEDSTFLQQAAYISGGLYMKLPRSSYEDSFEMAQYLIDCFLPAHSTREVLKLPDTKEVDFRASCFETRKLISHGFTCSVCLSTYSDPVKKCSTCGVEFREEDQISTKPPRAAPPLARPPLARPPLVRPPLARPPAGEGKPALAKPPLARAPAANPPIAKRPPMAQPPAAQSTKPALAKPPQARPPIAKPPIAKPPIAKPPIAKPPAAKAPPLAKPPLARPPLARPPMAKKPPMAKPPMAKPPSDPD